MHKQVNLTPRRVLLTAFRYVDALKCDICLLTDYDRLKLFKFHTPDNLKKISAELFAFSAFGKSRDSPLYIVAAATFSNLLQTLGRLGLRPSSARTAPAPSNPYPGQSSRSKRTLAQVCAGSSRWDFTEAIPAKSDGAILLRFSRICSVASTIRRLFDATTKPAVLRICFHGSSPGA
jgi:hypothetical protein